jgi:plasmid stabilization system protein ParE
LPRIRKTVQATKDLDDIWFFIAADNVTAADTLLDKVAEGSAMLAANPFLGRARPSWRLSCEASPSATTYFSICRSLTGSNSCGSCMVRVTLRTRPSYNEVCGLG